MGCFYRYVLTTYLFVHWVLALIGGGVDTGPELPPVITAQQQQAEQMKVYWKVCLFLPSPCSSPKTDDT